MLTYHKEINRKRTAKWILELPPISCSVIKIHGFSIPIQPYLPKPRAYKPFEPVVFKPVPIRASTWAWDWVASLRAYRKSLKRSCRGSAKPIACRKSLPREIAEAVQDL